MNIREKAEKVTKRVHWSSAGKYYDKDVFAEVIEAALLEAYNQGVRDSSDIEYNAGGDSEVFYKILDLKKDCSGKVEK